MKMRRLALLFAVLTSAQGLSVQAQDTLPPTFRAGTTLIEFTIVVRDSQGNPVTDLTKDDISITEQGQPRAVEFFRFDGAPPQPSPNVLPPGHFTNRFETSPNAARHITAILIDAMNMMAVAKTMQFTQATIRNQILAYLDALPPHTRVGLFRLGRGKIDVLHDFTDDVASLRAQAAKMDLLLPELFDTPGHRPADAPPSGVSGSAESANSRAMAEAAFAKATGAVNAIVQTNRVDLTLPGLEALGNHLARFPGRKNIVWVGNGMPLYLGGSRAQKGRDYEPRMRRTAERLATQGVAVYPIAQPAKDLTPESVREALLLFAGITGGRVTFTMNDPMEALKTTAVDQRAIYSVGFYAVAAPDNKWHPIAVQVRRPNVTVTHRRGYLSEAPAVQPLEWEEEQWRTALANPLSSSILRLDGQIAPAAGAGPRTIDFQMQIALDDLHFREGGGKQVAEVEIATAEKIASGDFSFRIERATLGRSNSDPGAVAPYVRQWTLRPDTRTVRVIVRDRFTGRYGTLDIPTNPTIR
jgi:VWFA-related protein